ncbi:prepilin-type N-terminal cleavage/methylation domain-containing protein [Planococcus soli]|uniref:prepilin-type N-terminal cleavage/methylation domain-containing protein n=1 Tax=Planococcus soli TaxID=2666072 RepID=UPI00115F51C1|nr:prepilin-type N-terminal cleavage/methylation domain-containing protein [Planococcus soli]
MKKYLQKKLNNEKGMTLIELLAVIVIIAIIAAIAIPAIGNVIENSRVGAIKSDALSAISAANLYYADNPTVTAPVPLSTLDGDYMDDLGSLTATSTVTAEGVFDGAGTVSGVTLTFNDADKTLINSLANNTANTEGVGNATNGIVVTR